MKKIGSNGFTLIELILVIALLALTITLSGIFYSNFYLSNSTSAIQKMLTFQLRKAQSYSMMGRQGGGWGVTFVGGNIVLYRGNSYATRTAGLDESYSVPSNITISGLNETNFERKTGYPNVTSTVLINGAGISRQVSVQSQGVISQF